jgi:VCBS repeat-containing protein
MTDRHSRKNSISSKKLRKRRQELNRSRARRNLRVEPLEVRRLLAVGPELLEIEAGGRSIDDGDVRHEPFTNLLFRFDSNDSIAPSTLAGFELSRAGDNGILGDADDIVITPGWRGLGNSANEVILRFAETLPDDVYGIHVDGTVTDASGQSFNGGEDLDIAFTLDQGTQVVSVVPQPVTRDPDTGELTQAADQVIVYFNSAQLDPDLVSNPAFYQLTDEVTGDLLFPEEVQYDADSQQATLVFSEDLPAGTFHLQIGRSDEPNDTVDGAVSAGTISQRAEYKVIESAVNLDSNGDPITVPILDNDTAISRISVGDIFMIEDLEVELNMDHAWSPDLRVFLVGPDGDRVELIRDVGTDVLGGQIYGRKYDDTNANGVQDQDEPGLEGWTIFIDDNLNSKLDPGERSTVTDADGNYSFVGLELGQTYRIAEVAQPMWTQTSPVSGGREYLFSADFSNGANQELHVIPDPLEGEPTEGTFRLEMGTDTSDPITYTGVDDTTAANIQSALAEMVDPGIEVTVTVLGGDSLGFGIAFALSGVGTPVDHAILRPVGIALDHGNMVMQTVESDEGFTTSGLESDEWHLTAFRGRDAGHSAQQSFYFGTGEDVDENTPGSYQNNADGTLTSPPIDLRDQRITGQVFLDINHLLDTEDGFDFASIDVIDAEGNVTNVFNSSSSTTSFAPLSVNLTPFVGRVISVAFSFDSDGSVTREGWFVDDVRVSVQRGTHDVTLSETPTDGISKNVDFGATKGTTIGPDAFGYEAFAVGSDFIDITETGTSTLQKSVDAGFAVQAGGTAQDDSNALAQDADGNLYITGSFLGSSTFGEAGSEVTLNSNGNSDIFVAKYDPAGALLWAIGIGGVGTDAGSDIAVDAAGNVVVSGRFSGSVDFGDGSPLASNGGSDAFVARFTTDGDLDWVRQFGGSLSDAAHGVDVTAAGAIAATGHFSNTVDFNPGPGFNLLTSAGDNDIFVVRLTSAGDYVSAVGYGSTGTDQGRAIAFDNSGSLLVAGSFANTVDFAAGPANISLTSDGLSDGFMMKLNGTSTAWAQRRGESSADYATAITADASNNVIVTGTMSGDAYVMKMSPGGGITWVREFGGGATDVAEGVTVDSDGNIFVTGSYRQTVDFDPGGATAVHTSVGGRDIFVSRFSPAGEFGLVRVSGSILDDVGMDVAIDAADNAIYTGSFRDTIDLSVGPQSETLISDGNSDIFLAKVAIVEGLDDATVQLTADMLDGFQFEFYGITYDELFFSSNGLITFGSENDSPDNTDLTDPPPQASIAPFWEDMITGSGDREAAFWEVVGEGNAQRLIIQWNGVHLTSPTGFAEGPLNFQVVLSEHDNSIQFNYETVTGPLLVDSGADQPVGTFGTGQQDSPAIATDELGNYVVVWEADGQDGSGLAIYARRFDADANPLSAEFRVNSTTQGDQTVPRVAMNASGQFVVVWQETIGQEFNVRAQVYDANGNRIGGELLVHSDISGAQRAPDVIIDEEGNFVVTWTHEDATDPDQVFDEIYARRFDANGVPLGTVDEIQRLEFLGPPANFSTFTLDFQGATTGPIAYAGAGNATITARNIRQALRGLPTIGNQITVTPIAADEIQTITLTGNPTSGTFRLDYNGNVTADIIYTGPANPDGTAGNIGDALAAIPDLAGGTVVVTAIDGYRFNVLFTDDLGLQDHPLMVVDDNSLDQGEVNVSETVRGASVDTTTVFDVLFTGADGSTDQPMLVHSGRFGGVTHIQIEELVKGDSGEFRVNNVQDNSQEYSRLAIDADGNFVIAWQSEFQDGSDVGIFAKLYDSDGVAQPEEADEIQQISLLGPPAPNSVYSLRFGGQTTGLLTYTGGNVTDAINIEAALRNLPNLSDSVIVTPAPGISDEVQRITFSVADDTDGTFVLAHAGLVTAAIDFAGTAAADGITTAGNIEDALRALPNLSDSVTVVPAFVDSAREFLVTFSGPDGNIDQPLLFLLQENLSDPLADVEIAAFNDGGFSTTDFIVEFRGRDGRQDQPLVELANNSGGVIGLDAVALVEGADAEFPINETTLGYQRLPAVSRDATTGHFVVAWESADQDETGIFARVFDADGNALTSDFQVNTFTEGNQHDPEILITTDGNFLVTWRSMGQIDQIGEVYARRFAPDGTPLSDELLVNKLTAGNQFDPVVAARPDGEYVMAFASQAGAGGVHSLRFAADGTRLDSDEIQVSTTGTPSQVDPVVVRNATGDYVVVWQETVRDPSLDAGIYAQAFFADGTARSGEISIPQTTELIQEFADVAIDSAGNFVVTWTTEVEVEEGSDSNIMARHFAPDGTPLGDEFVVNTATDRIEFESQVGMDAAGNFTIVWNSTDEAFEDAAIMARRYDAAGTPIDANEFTVNTTIGTAGSAAIDVNASGEFVVVWSLINFSDFSADLYAQRFAADGSPNGAEFVLNDVLAEFAELNDTPAVAIADDGSFVVTWALDDLLAGANVVFARQFDSTGTPEDVQFVVNGAGATSAGPEPDISMAEDGSYVITWSDESNGGVRGQRYASDGDMIGDAFDVPDSTAGTQSSVSVSVGPNGDFIVGWLDAGQGGQQVFVEQFTSELPSVGIKAEGPQAPWENLVPLWVDGGDNPFVGSGLSTKLLVVEQIRQPVFAVDIAADEIHELDPDTAAIVRSIPLPDDVSGDAGLAFAGNTLYLVSDDGLTLYELDPATGAVVDTTDLTALGISDPVNGLAYLNGHIVGQDAANDVLHFIDPFQDTLVASVTAGTALKGGLTGAGSRGTLFAVDADGDIVELDPADGSVVNSFTGPAEIGVGLAFLEGHVWVGDAAGNISKMDPDTGATVDSWASAIPLTGLGADDGGAVESVLVGNYRPFVNTVLDDEADISITAGEGPFTGRFVPIESLSVFDGQSINGMWQLEIVDTATGDEGELFSWSLIVNDMEDTPADYQAQSNIGDDSPNGLDDVDLYNFDVLAAGMVTIELDPASTLDSVVRIFDAAGNEMAIADNPGTGAAEMLMVDLPAAGAYIIGVSSSANVAYSPLDGSGAGGGTSTGNYVISISFDQPVAADDDNSSFDTATDFGVLGQANRSLYSSINNDPMVLRMPGAISEPGHRDIPAESHYNDTGTSGSDFVPDRLLLRFNADVSPAERDVILAQRGLEIVKDLSGTLVVEAAAGIDVLKQTEDLKSLQAIDFVEPDYLLTVDAVFPNDPSFGELWGLDNTGQSVGGMTAVADADIDAPEAWEFTTGSPDTVIAVIDTGVDYTHPDLVANMWMNPGEIAGDGVDNDGNGFIDDVFGIDTANDDSDPMDGNDHGTHVAGTIAGAGDDGTGVVGVNWQAQIMALKFLPDFGGGATSDAIEAIDYMTMMKTQYGINIVASNNSWGGGAFSNALQDSIQRSVDAGIIFVAAAGNDGLDTDAIPHYPSSYDLDGILSVAASDPEDKLATLPEFGSTFNSNYGATSVDVAAPGVSILSTTPGNTYSVFGGTSMAAPHVTGVIGLLASYEPNATVQDLKLAIMEGADPSAALDGTVITGARLNAYNSLALIAGGLPTPPPSSVPTFYYNFQDFYGVLPTGDTPENVITENQKQRTREVFEFYENLLGASFVETADSGLTVVTGDLRAMAPNIPTGPGGVAGLSEGSMYGRVIMDAAEDWGISEYGGSWFTTAMHEIGHSLGLGHTYDLPALTIMGSNTLPGTPPAEPVFPGNADIIHAQFLHEPASNDLDLYKFTVPETGRVTAEIVAERLEPSSSLLDAKLTLYRETAGPDGPVREIIAANDDYYSSDSWLDLHLDAGSYFIAVASTGNEGFDPATSDTGFGGTTEGVYQLKLNFLADSVAAIADDTATKLDGDSDGTPGGDFDFWFQTGATIFVDKTNDTTASVDGDGSLANPYDTISAALDDAASRIVVPRTGGMAIADGDQIYVSDGDNPVVTFEFDSDGVVTAGTVSIPFDATATPEEIAAAIATAINDVEDLNVTATANAGIVSLDQLDMLDVRQTPGLLMASNPVRILGNGGDDGQLTTLEDNVPYLVGIDPLDNTLADGEGLFVPQGVTVMIDAGALLKLRSANVDVGTSALGASRAAGALQVLGTPEASVYFRSFHNDLVGGDTDGPGEDPQPGNWGGLVFRDDSDMEQDGIFLNWVNHADINNGGGKVLMDSVEETFTPVDMIDARPTVSHSIIRNSADAALAASPNSFEDSLERIGPDIHNNLILENSINGLFIRIRTELGEKLNRLEVPARWDDTDVVHVVTENLLIGSTPGGPELDEATGDFNARLDARLRIDPGVIVKLEGSRIEAEISSQLIVEGTTEQPVILTSLKDDRFGGSGTFDTSNDLDATSPQPGQWGGLFLGAMTKASLDHVMLAYAGGLTPIEGDFDSFAAIEAHQAELRVTNSLITNNATGQASSNRSGRGGNEASTIFVRGAQPIIVNNQLRDNLGPAISVDANSLRADFVNDWGRTTGMIDAYDSYVDNHGPLVRMNLLDNQDVIPDPNNPVANQAIEGMVVRGQVLTTDSVWDDTDIAHVLYDQVILLNHHTESGLRLQSSDRESLVIKMGDPDAGFTANGQPLDIDDRIGGSIYVLGRPGYPVVFTSLSDDSAAAGVALNGAPLGDTNNDGYSEGTPGDWAGILLDQYSNDRNVEILRERELVLTEGVDTNGVPSSAQFVGVLAPDLKSGDSDRRLGFQIQGFIAPDDPSDVDVYSFDARGQTEIWIDIDRSGPSLDTVVELLTADGTVLASSLDNDTLTGIANPLVKDAWRGYDYYTIDVDDAGMRVVLPGDPAVPEAYYVRVRSQPAEDHEADLEGGLTSGEYQLQIRLQQIDEIPGSTIRNASLNYATNAIEIVGLPNHSPLAGETAESTVANDSLGAAQEIGNLLVTDRNVISVAGDLSAESDVDWYKFTLDYEYLQAIGGVNGGGKTWSTIFDIDYADGLSRPDTTITVYDAAGNLILVSRDSNIEDDQPEVGQGADTDDLSRGSFGVLDPFIGSVQMPAGVVPSGSTAEYYVAISSNAYLPEALNATFNGGATNALVRLEPVNSVQRIAEDHIGFDGHVTGLQGYIVQPEQTLFGDIGSTLELETHVTPFTLSDVVMYVTAGDVLYTVDGMTGVRETRIGNISGGNPRTEDIAMRSDGRLYGVESLPQTQNTAGRLVEIDWADAAQSTIGNDSIPDFDPNTDPPDPQQLSSDIVDALAFTRTGFDDGSNTPEYALFYSVRNGFRPDPDNSPNSVIHFNESTLYRANPDNGSAAVVNGEPYGRIGSIGGGSVGITTGMAFAAGALYGVSSDGFFYQISTGNGSVSNVVDLGGISFAGLTTGPQNLQNGAYADMLFAIDTNGNLYALDTNGQLQGVFAGGATSVSTPMSGATGLAFSPADYNLWHPTTQRGTDAGHGVNDSFDNSRRASVDWSFSVNGRTFEQGEGGASFYFGFETWQDNPDPDYYYTYGPNAQYGILSEAGHRDLSSNTEIAGSYNVPGGAVGSLVTNSFNLGSYDVADKPTLYFNYFMETQDANSGTNEMRDSFRVQASIDGGTTWYMLATNNSVMDEELPEFISVSANASDDPRQRVQELFDNTGGWRQARIDMSEFAGFDDIQLRFDFSTAGEMNQGVPGDSYGDWNDEDRAQNNNFEGVYIDDIIIGFAERGEMVTGSTAQNAFFQVPQDPLNPISEVLVGPYQLEIRRGTEYGANDSGVDPEISIYQQFDTNTRMIEALLRLGDQNADRAQGNLQIENNIIRFSSEYGILVDAGQRDTVGDVPHPGAARHLPTLNSQSLVYGLTVQNNVIAESGTGGILFSGDPSTAGQPEAVVPFGRLVNNTIYGGGQPTGTGITVEENASPTILNNIVANNETGILVDASSSSSVIGANLFQLNTDDGAIGSNAIQLGDSDPLFLSPGSGNFYLAKDSQAIDSSLNRLDDRPSILAVTSPLGIPPAPIVAPDRDLYAQLRIDDPDQAPPPGLGSNIFKDRGAVERADFSGPFASLILPEDNDGVFDLDADLGSVVTEELVIDDFAIQLEDEGIGIDDNSVIPSNLTLILNQTVLTQGTDYIFRYDPIGNVINLEMRADVAPRRNIYTIVLENDPQTGIRDLAANGLRANFEPGETRFTIMTAGLNDPPVATEDSYIVDENALLVADDADGSVGTTNNDSVLVNDFDADFDVLTAELLTPPAHAAGTFVLNADGTFEYQHDGSETTSDSFTYRAIDELGEVSNEVTVTISINPVNDVPFTLDDAYVVDEGGALIADDVDGAMTPAEPNDDGVAVNDYDEEGDDFTVELVTGPNHSIDFNLYANGTFDYVHDGSETLEDTFQYKLVDTGGGESAVATVTITINPINDAPVTADDVYTVAEGDLLVADDVDGSVNGTNDDSVLVNDTDPEGDAMTVELVDGPQHDAGSFLLNANGTFTYHHDGSETLTDSFTYQVRDALGAVSRVTTVAIDITPVNDVPVVENDAYTVDEGAELITDAATGVMANDSDAENDVLTAILVTAPQHAANFVLNDDGSFTYEHDGSETTLDSFEYKVTDGTDESSVAVVTINITPVNDLPVAVDDAYIVAEGDLLAVHDTDGSTPEVNDDGVLTNDSDAEQETLTAVLVDSPLHADGTFVLNADGTFDYQHDGSETVSDSFTYEVIDASGGISAVATVRIEITPVNDPPIAVDDVYSVDEGDTLLVDDADGTVTPADPDDDGVLVNDIDAEGDSMTVTLVSEPFYAASFTLNDDGTFTYEHDGSEFSQDRFEYQVTDENGAVSNVATVLINVNPINDTPVAVDDVYSMRPSETLITDDPLGIITPDDRNDDGVLANDVDAELTTLNAVLVDGPQHASDFTFNTDGTFSYTPVGNLTVETDTFTYLANDGELDSNLATVTIVFTEPPVAQDDEFLVLREKTTTLDVLANDGDPDGSLDESSIVIEVPPEHGKAIVASGKVRYTPDDDYLGPDAFEYSVADDSGARSNIATVSIQVVDNLRPWRNAFNPVDVNGDSLVSPWDALIIINYLHFNGPTELPVPPTGEFSPPPYLDVTGDNLVSPLDALQVINALNRAARQSGSGEPAEGEPGLADPGFDALAVTPATGDEPSTGLSSELLVDSSTSSDGGFSSLQSAGGEPLQLAADDSTDQPLLVGDEDDSTTGTVDGLANGGDDQLGDLLDDIAEDIAEARDDELLADIALIRLLKLKGDA